MATVATSWMPQAHQRAATAPYTTTGVASTHDYHQQTQHHQPHHQHQRQATTPASTSSANAASASSSSSRRAASKSTTRTSDSSTNYHSNHTSSSSPSSASSTQPCDRFYGHRDLAELCERVILALFSCPLDSTASSVDASSSSSTTKAAPRLAEFVAYALHRTRLPLAVTHQALFLLKRLKSRFPAARGSSGHRLFISALMLASKSSCDDTYSNKSWTIVGQGLFSLREVNQMERELFGYLGFRVNVEPEELDDFVFGLQHGRIHAPTEPVSPAMGINYGFDSTPMESAVSSSPSVASEPAFNGHEYVGHNGYAPRSSKQPANVFNSRASFSGYPSVHSASSQPMAQSASAIEAESANVDGHSTSRTSSASRYNQSRLTAAPTVPMQGQYYPSPSAPVASYACARGLSASSDGTSYVPSPFGSQASSGSTTPESPTSQLDSPPDCDWTQASIVDHSQTHHKMDSEQVDGVYDREHDLYGSSGTKQRIRYPSAQRQQHFYRS